MSNNNQRMNINPPEEIFVDILDIARSMNSRRNRQNIMNLLFESAMEEIYIEQRQDDYLLDVENRMLEIAMTESLTYYNPQEKKPGIKLDIKSQIATSDHKNQNCTICNSDIEIDENITSLECDHIFHTDCIGEWVMYKSVCPCCRAPVKTKDEVTSNGE